MNLKGTKVLIMGNHYMVQSTDVEDNQEVVVLTRTIEKNQEEYPTTIYDLGYKSPANIKFRGKKIKKASQKLGKLFDTPSTFEVASIDKSGLIKIEIISSVYGSSILDSSVEVNSSIDSQISRIVIESRLLTEKYMLLKQLKKAQKKYTKKYSRSAKIDKVIDDGLKTKSPESMLKDLMNGKGFDSSKFGSSGLSDIEDMPPELKKFLKSAEDMVAGLIPKLEQDAETPEEKQAAKAIKDMFEAMKNLKGPRP